MSKECHGHERAGRWDLAGGILSFICAVHCLALPILLPFAGAIVHSLWLEVLLMVAAIAVGSFALRHGFTRHGFRLPSILFACGMLAIIFGNWVLTAGEPLSTHTPDEHAQTPASLVFVGVGACLIVTGHVLNFVWERRWIRSHRS
jgi:ribose/xylose/arabinose/galactoside ABC-type transport system permease subunit